MKALFIRFERSNNLSADAFSSWHFNDFHLKRSLNHALAIYLKNPCFVIKSAKMQKSSFKYTEIFCKNYTPKYMTHLKKATAEF